MKITISKEFDFEAAHNEPLFPEGHKCRRMHGHSFKVTVFITGQVDPSTGILYDHSKISEVVDPLIEQLDHHYINEVPGLERGTMELLAYWFWRQLKPKLPELSRIELQETPRAKCIYEGE